MRGGDARTLTTQITAIVGSVRQFGYDIDLESFPGMKVENIKPQVDRFAFPDGQGVAVVPSGRL